MIPYHEQPHATVYCGDCRDYLPQLMDQGPSLVFMDPPYGVGYQYGDAYTDTAGSDYDAMIRDVVAVTIGSGPVVAVTPGMRHIGLWPTPDWMLSWHKPGSTRRNGLGGFNTWEPVLIYGKPSRRVYQDSIRLPDVANHASGPAAQHPCPKPLALLRWLVESLTDPGDLILDPFCGSGTTLRAALDTGRRGVGIELDPAYCAITVEVLRQTALPLATSMDPDWIQGQLVGVA